MLHGSPAVARRLEQAKSNRFLAALPPEELDRLTPYLRAVSLERGDMLHDAGDDLAHVYFPHAGMVSVVAVMQGGATVETVSVGRAGVVGAAAGLGSRCAVGRAVVQLPGLSARLASSHFASAARESEVIRDLVVRYNDLLIAQIQQAVACNALHTMEARLCRWLLQSHDCGSADVVPLTQEFLGQMLGVRRTTVTITARLLQSAGMIRYRRGLIHIVDRTALEETACECYDVIRRQTDDVFPSSA